MRLTFVHDQLSGYGACRAWGGCRLSIFSLSHAQSKETPLSFSFSQKTDTLSRYPARLSLCSGLESKCQLEKNTINADNHTRYLALRGMPTYRYLTSRSRSSKGSESALGVPLHVPHQYLFGSVLHDAADADSDVDILVELDQPAFDSYMDLKFFLEDSIVRLILFWPTP